MVRKKKKINLAYTALLIALLIFLPACLFEKPNYVDYKNFEDDHSIRYKHLFRDQIKKDNANEMRDKQKKELNFYRNYSTDY